MVIAVVLGHPRRVDNPLLPLARRQSGAYSPNRVHMRLIRLMRAIRFMPAVRPPMPIASPPSTATGAAPAPACACGRLRRAARALTQLYDDAMAPSGLRITQFSLLRTVAR
ncbi:MAG: hypothetical protein ACREYD_03915, partial [Casimicrobiaceae bacterium]